MNHKPITHGIPLSFTQTQRKKRVKKSLVVGALHAATAAMFAIASHEATALNDENLAISGRAAYAYVYGGYVYLSAPDATSNPSYISFWNTPESTFSASSTWNQFGSYYPSNVDPSFDYCHVWDGHIFNNGTTWYLSFSAVRVTNGQCSGVLPDDNRRTVFTASGGSLTSLGGPIPYRENEVTGLRSWSPTTNGGNACSGTGKMCMRMDAGAGSYVPFVWWSNSTNAYSGNNIAIGTLSNNTVNPAVDVVPSYLYEQQVNESAKLYQRNGYYYLFYMSGYWNGNYSLRYLKSTTIAGLRRTNTGDAVPAITFPEYSPSTLTATKNRGAATIVNINGSPIMFYQVLPIGSLRSTYWTHLAFDANNNPVPRLDWLQGVPAKGRLRRGDNWGRGWDMCLDDPNGSTQPGEQQRQWTCNTGVAQKYDMIDMGNLGAISDPGSYMLRSQASGMCLDVKNGVYQNGQPVIQYHCSGAANQRWVLDYSGSYFRLKSRGNTTYCLTFPNDQQYAAINPCTSANWWYWN